MGKLLLFLLIVILALVFRKFVDRRTAKNVSYLAAIVAAVFIIGVIMVVTHE